MLGSLSLSRGKRGSTAHAHAHALGNHRAQNPQVMNRDSNLYGLNTVERVIFVGAHFSYELPISNICTAHRRLLCKENFFSDDALYIIQCEIYNAKYTNISTIRKLPAMQYDVTILKIKQTTD